MSDSDDSSSTNSSNYNNNYWIDFVSGWCAGAVGVLLVQPVDTLLTRHQAGLHTNGNGLMRAATKTTPSLLYKGAWPMIWTVPLQNTLLMGGYGIGQSYYNSEDASRWQQYAAILVSGTLGGIAQSFLMSPVELVKIQRQCAPMVAASSAGGAMAASTTTTAFSTIPMSSALQQSPPLTVWKVPLRGLGATLLRDGIPHGVWFVAYQWCKDEMESQYDDSTPTSAAVTIPLVSGAFAATVAWGVGYPADIIKTKIQYASSSQQSTTNVSIFQTVQHIMRAHPHVWHRGLYAGFGWKLVRAIPSSMVGFGVYEVVKQQIVQRL
ncbi:hypothetical protein MPSEU_000675300 [Mayamaea pseudoterrestris]|nr:hypothetical protein MPSEU_000675300 [Mayamaea pseudoterrestris]